MSAKKKDKEDQRIEELLEVKAGGIGAGVCGREWCELCGKEGSFTGFVSAMAAHMAGGRYVCGRCSRSEDGTSWGTIGTAQLDRLILDRGYRYCGGCGREVLLQEHAVEEARRLPFTCPKCHGLDRGKAARRRYLEHEATKQGGLERAAAHIYWAKAGIEEILGDED
jgi:ribosomal protein S27AE